MSATAQRWLWRALKVAVVLAIFVGVGWTLHHHLARLDAEALAWDPAWLALAGLIYIVGLLPCALFWWWSLRSLGQRPRFLAAVRAYYISQLGKYVPGKALVPILRTACIRGPEVRTGVAVVAVIYETLTIMAAGGMIGAVTLSEVIPVSEGTLLLFLGVLLAAILLAPSLLNWLAGLLAGRFQVLGKEPVPRLPFTTFFGGLALGALSWVCLGLSLWATSRAVNDVPLTPDRIVQCTAFIALATVAGFVTPAPGGLGVREWILMELLTTDLGPGAAGIVAILLRVTWIVSELAAAGVLYRAPLVFSKKALPPQL